MTLEDVKTRTNTMNAFMINIGAELVSLSRGHSEIDLTLTEFHKNLNGMVHGGVMLTMIDSATGAACRSYGGTLVTVESKTNFLRGIRAEGQTIKAIADVVHNGRSTKVCTAKLYDGDRLACIATTTMFVVNPEPHVEQG